MRCARHAVAVAGDVDVALPVCELEDIAAEEHLFLDWHDLFNILLVVVYCTIMTSIFFCLLIRVSGYIYNDNDSSKTRPPLPFSSALSTLSPSPPQRVAPPKSASPSSSVTEYLASWSLLDLDLKPSSFSV